MRKERASGVYSNTAYVGEMRDASRAEAERRCGCGCKGAIASRVNEEFR